MGGATTSTISNGTLAVDFYDPTSKDLIWRGSATKTLNPSGNQQKDMKKLNKAVAKLLKNFPPPQSNKCTVIWCSCNFLPLRGGHDEP